VRLSEAETANEHRRSRTRRWTALSPLRRTESPPYPLVDHRIRRDLVTNKSFIFML
jgi:hypothetical protein